MRPLRGFAKRDIAGCDESLRKTSTSGVAGGSAIRGCDRARLFPFDAVADHNPEILIALHEVVVIAGINEFATFDKKHGIAASYRRDPMGR